MPRLSKSAFGALGVSAATLIYLWEAWKLPFGSAHNPDLGFMPMVMGFIVLSLSLALILKEIFRPKTHAQEASFLEDREEGDKQGLRKPLILSAAILAYPVAFTGVGFVLSTVALITVSLRVMEYRGWVGSLLIAAGVTGIAYFFFGSWLHVNFPRGFLG
jgi:hypothetical protein